MGGITLNTTQNFSLQDLDKSIRNIDDNVKIRGKAKMDKNSEGGVSFTLYASTKEHKNLKVETKATSFFGKLIENSKNKSTENAMRLREHKQNIASEILEGVFSRAKKEVGNDLGKHRALDHILKHAPKDLKGSHLKTMVSDALDVVDPSRIVKRNMAGLGERARQLESSPLTTSFHWLNLIGNVIKLGDQTTLLEPERDLQNVPLMKAFEGLAELSKREGHTGGGLSPSIRNEVLRLLEFVVKHEVTESTSKGTLFRNGACWTPFLMKFEGFAMLKNETKQFIASLTQSETMNEVHDLNAEGKNSEETQIKRHQAASFFNQQFFDVCDHLGISSDPNVRNRGLDRLPQEICDQMKLIYTEVTQKYGAQEGRKAVSGALLLRLICPLMTSPQGDGSTQPLKLVESKPSEESGRNLNTISAMIQALGNGTEMKGNKSVLDTAVKSRGDAWMQFVDALVNRGKTSNDIKIEHNLLDKSDEIIEDDQSLVGEEIRRTSRLSISDEILDDELIELHEGELHELVEIPEEHQIDNNHINTGGTNSNKGLVQVDELMEELTKVELKQDN